jgi:hypothetical protein
MRKALPLLLALTLSGTALADHTITMRTTFEDPSMAGMKTTSVTRTKNKRQRIEDTTDMNGAKMVTVRLVMCDLEQEAQIDPDAKIYTVHSLSASAIPVTDPSKPAEVTKGTGKMSTNVKVQDLGVEKVAQLDAHHWIVDSVMKGSGCIGSFDYTSKREFWTSALPSFACPILNGIWTSQTINECQVSNELTGDVAKFQETMKHQVVKEYNFSDGKKVMTRELVDFSTAALDDALFSLDGYRKVSDAEFQQAQQQKMMKMYMPKQ